MEHLSSIVEVLNERFGTDLTDVAKLLFDQFEENWVQDRELSDQAQNNTIENFRLVFDPGAIPVWAGVLLRFENEVKQGDLIVYPRKSDRTMNLGVVDGEYQWHGEAPVHRNRRPVRWIQTKLPRGVFSQGALYKIGSAITLFRVKKHVAEFVQASDLDQSAINAEEPEVVEVASRDEASATEDAPNAERFSTALAITSSRRLRRISRGMPSLSSQRDFSKPWATAPRCPLPVLIAASISLPTRIRSAWNPMIKVQCKSTEGKIGSPEVSSLAGKMGRDEWGLFFRDYWLLLGRCEEARERQNFGLASEV